MRRFIALGISGVGLALILVGSQTMAKDGSIVRGTHGSEFHTLSKMSMKDTGPMISMTHEQLNAVEGKQNLSDGNLRQEILTSAQAIVNQGLSRTQQPGDREILAQEITISTQEIINQHLTN